MADAPDIPDDRIPEELPNEAGRQRIRIIYSRLGALRHELKDCSSTEVTSGSLLIQYRDALGELTLLTNRDFSGFMPNLQPANDDGLTCLTVDLRIAAGMLIEELRPEFVPEQGPYYSPVVQPSPTMTVNTNATAAAQADVQQTTELEVKVFNNIKVELEGKLDELKANYTEGSKEHTFITKLKAGLGAVKNAAGIFTLAYTTAHDIGLSEHDLHHLLRSLGLL